MHKVREVIKSSEYFPTTGIVNVDEYVVGGYNEGNPGRSYDSNKKKAVCTIALTEDGKVKHFYPFQIQDYSAKSLRKIFEKHIDKKAKLQLTNGKNIIPLVKL